jgi:hypothetical protein
LLKILISILCFFLPRYENCFHVDLISAGGGGRGGEKRKGRGANIPQDALKNNHCRLSTEEVNKNKKCGVVKTCAQGGRNHTETAPLSFPVVASVICIPSGRKALGRKHSYFTWILYAFYSSVHTGEAQTFLVHFPKLHTKCSRSLSTCYLHKYEAKDLGRSLTVCNTPCRQVSKIFRIFLSDFILFLAHLRNILLLSNVSYMRVYSSLYKRKQTSRFFACFLMLEYPMHVTRNNGEINPLLPFDTTRTA